VAGADIQAGLEKGEFRLAREQLSCAVVQVDGGEMCTAENYTRPECVGNTAAG
jgi:hypothetical protein